MTKTSAFDLARSLHFGQVDKGGKPYIEHLGAVVGILLRRWPHAPQHAIDAAWLHDVLEDTDSTISCLMVHGIGSRALFLVNQLTRPKQINYLDWIGAIADNGQEWTIKIKLADNEHNCDPARAIQGSKMVEQRYFPARRILEAALVRRFPA